MNDETKIFLKLYNELNNRNIDSLLNDLIETNKVIISLNDSFYLDKIEIPIWKQHLEILLLKYSFHSFSLVKLLEGTTVTDFYNVEKKFPDIPSIRIILRSIIENYLIIKHLFFDPKNDCEGEFRYYLYEWSGLIARQRLNIHAEEYRLKSEQEKKQIKEIEMLIGENLYFKSLDSKIQKEILRSKKAKEYSWDNLLDDSGIDFIKPIWKLYSNTAHSEFLGAIQFRGYLKSTSDDLENEIWTNISSALQINTVLISTIKEKFPNTKSIFDNFTLELSTKIKLWYNVAKNKNGS